MIKKPFIAPSVLSCDFTKMGEQIRQVEGVGCSFFHIDVMDGMFVPNISIGQPVVKSLRKFTRSVLDTHLMITEPERYIDSFADAGADILTIHIESTANPAAVLKKIKDRGVIPAVSIKPKTDPSLLQPLLPLCGMILVMTVEPGFGGQKMISEALDNLRQVRKMVDGSGYKIDIEVDGGIDTETIGLAVAAGADIIVAGSAVFGKSDPAAAYLELDKAIGDYTSI